MKLIDRLLEALASGEVVAVVLAGGFGWGWAEIRRRLIAGHQREIELGRLRFREENALATREAVKEGMGELRELILPAIQELRCDIQDLRNWVGTVDSRADESLRLAQTLRETQAQWLKRAEAEINSILTVTESPTLIKGLFREDTQDD